MNLQSVMNPNDGLCVIQFYTMGRSAVKAIPIWLDHDSQTDINNFAIWQQAAGYNISITTLHSVLEF